MDVNNPAGASGISEEGIAAEPAGFSICIVDDDPSVRDSLVALLEAHALNAFAYASGAEFDADRHPRRIACLVVDHHMPGMNGLQTIEALRDRGIAVPTILITGRLDSTIQARALDLGVMATLEKPFSAQRLVQLVRASLPTEGSQQRRGADVGARQWAERPAAIEMSRSQRPATGVYSRSVEPSAKRGTEP